MRVLLAASLAGLALVSLAACNKSATTPAAGESSTAAAPAAGGPAGPLTLEQIPHRKPGLWSQTMSMDGQPSQGAIQLCVDATSEAKMNITAQQIQGATCATPQLSRNLDGSITFTESCDMGALGKIQTSGTIKGDFNSSYTGTITSTTTGSPRTAMNGVHTMVMTGTYMGACPAGQVGGDMILPNGMKINATPANTSN